MEDFGIVNVINASAETKRSARLSYQHTHTLAEEEDGRDDGRDDGRMKVSHSFFCLLWHTVP